MRLLPILLDHASNDCKIINRLIQIFTGESAPVAGVWRNLVTRSMPLKGPPFSSAMPLEPADHRLKCPN